MPNHRLHPLYFRVTEAVDNFVTLDQLFGDLVAMFESHYGSLVKDEIKKSQAKEKELRAEISKLRLELEQHTQTEVPTNHSPKCGWFESLFKGKP